MIRNPGSIWIMGLSAAGKSTLARLLTEKLRSIGHACALLDGEEVRALFDDHLGHDLEARRKQTHRILRLARWISDQGILPVVAIIHPFEDDRLECRKTLPNYFEVYLRCDLAECIRRDTKNVYGPALAGQAKNVVGIDIPYGTPERSDVVLDSGEMSPEELLGALWQKLQRDFFRANDWD